MGETGRLEGLDRACPSPGEVESGGLFSFLEKTVGCSVCSLPLPRQRHEMVFFLGFVGFLEVKPMQLWGPPDRSPSWSCTHTCVHSPRV